MAKRKLKIALVAPLVTPIASPFVGGAQVMLYELALGLATRGHTVTIYAAQGSQLSHPNLTLVEIKAGNANLNLADFNAAAKGSAGVAVDTAFFDQANLFLQIFLDITQRQAEFDIVHAHAFDWPAYAFAALSGVPTVHTVHLPAVDSHINNLIATTSTKTQTSNCVTVSQACAATYASYFQFDQVIYNGINVAQIPFSPTASSNEFVVFVGRLSPEKGADLAIEIARRAGKKLILAGGIYDQEFFDTKIAPQLIANPQLEYRGLLERSALFELMGQAQAALFPARWDEPFGLALAEAQAAGTPVIAFRRGAAPEIVVEGQTGFLVEPDNLEAAAQALAKVAQIERKNCRERIEQKFSYDQMLEAYEAYYLSKISS